MWICGCLKTGFIFHIAIPNMIEIYRPTEIDTLISQFQVVFSKQYLYDGTISINIYYGISGYYYQLGVGFFCIWFDW